MDHLTIAQLLGNYGEFVSSLVIVVTLMFLLLQLRQASGNQQSLMQQGRTAGYVEIISSRTQPHLGEAFLRAMENRSLDDSQWVAVTAHIDAYFWHFEDCFLQFEAGTIDQASWNSDKATLTYLIGLPMFRAQWKVVRALSNGAYRDYVDALMRETPVTAQSHFRDLVNAQLAEELAGRQAS